MGSRTFIDGMRAGAVGRLWGSPGNPIPDAPAPSTPPPPPSTTAATRTVSRDTPGFEVADTGNFQESFQNQAPKDSLCNITQGTGALGAVMNLHIWNRILSPGEIKFASPKMTDRSVFTGQQPNTFANYLNKFLP